MKKKLQRFDSYLSKRIKTAFMGTLLVLTGSSLSFGQTTLPYSESFTSGTGWTMNTGQPNKWYIGDAGEGTGNFLYISGDRPLHPDNVTPAGGSGATNDYRFYGTGPGATSVSHAYKDFAFTGGASAFNLQFDWRLMGEGNFDCMRVWIVPTTATISPGTKINLTNTPTAVLVGTVFNGSNSWATSINYTLPASLQGSNRRLVFEWSNDNSGGEQRPAAIDNISLTAVTCLAPTALTASITPQTTATLSWTENGSATTWGVEYGVIGFTPTGTPMQTATTTPTATLTGLSANTTYQYYVRAQCGGSNSPWAGPFSFVTGYCVPTANASNYYTSGFTTSGALTNLTYAASTPPAGHYSDETTQTLTTYVGQLIDFTQNYTIGTHQFKIWVDWNNDFDFEDAGEQMHQSYATDIVTGNFTIPAAIANGAYRMRIRSIYDYNQNKVLSSCGAVIDGSAVDFTLNVITIPTCPAPNLLTVTGITPTSANFGWAENGTSSEWEIEFGVTGFTPTGIATTTVTNNPATITTLAANTTYQFYVRSLCGPSNNSLWAGPYTFTTPQELATLPYTDDFSSIQWSFVNGNEPNKWYIGAATGLPANSMYISHNGGLNNSYNIGTLSTTHAYRDVTFPAGTSTFSLKFDWKAYGEGFGTYYYDYLSVWVVPMNATLAAGTKISTANTPGAVQLGSNLLNTSTWVVGQEVIIPNAFAGTNSRIVFEWHNDGGSGDQDPAAVDNINLTVVNCPAPTALNATNITTTSAELSWTETATATDWEIQYGLATFFPNNGPVVTVGTNPFVLSGLQPASMYDYYVRAKCGPNDLSAWSGPYRFSTLCDVITVLPWNENFDNLPLVGTQLFPSCWVDENPGDWFTSDNISSTMGQTPFSGTNFLNIGNDADAKIWTPEFALTAGQTYEFSFQYAGDLGAGWDGSVYVNNTQSSVGATMIGTAFIVNGDLTVLAYQKEKFCFTPTTTGTYTFGIYVEETDFENYLSFDDFQLKIGGTSTGTDGALSICQSSAAVDLNTIITTTSTDGTWSYLAFPTSVNGNMFDPSIVTPGVHDVLFITNSCIVDTTVAKITVESSASAGIDGNLVVCRNEPMDLFAGLTGNFATNGVWTDPSNVIVPNGATTSSNIPGQYNFKYVVTNTSCPNDSSKVIVVVQGCNYVGVEDIAFKAFNLYPNPTSDVVYISNSGSTEVFNYEVLDMNGRLILQANQAINGTVTTEINLNQVEVGVYMVRVFNDTAEKTFRIVKN